MTSRYLGGDFDEDRIEQAQHFTQRSKNAQQNKIIKTTNQRAEEAAADDLPALPLGEVIQVYSLYSEVIHEQIVYLAVVRKTLAKVSATAIVVGDRVRFRSTGIFDESGRPQAVIEEILPRKTMLTRAESFKAIDLHPIVANAQQMLIVASLVHPAVKWGLVDRMIVAARSGGLTPIVCLNKIDLAHPEAQAASPNQEAADAFHQARQVMAHYSSMGLLTLQTSVPNRIGMESLRDLLGGRTTVLAGHSGAGKSSLIRAIQPDLDLRIGLVSHITHKGRHTTTSARRYPLDVGGYVIDTPGVKVFGLWGVAADNLIDYFPDIQDETAPPWRRQSFERIFATLQTGARRSRGD